MVKRADSVRITRITAVLRGEGSFHSVSAVRYSVLTSRKVIQISSPDLPDV
jgi:hypothetical protein